MNTFIIINNNNNIISPTNFMIESAKIDLFKITMILYYVKY